MEVTIHDGYYYDAVKTIRIITDMRIPSRVSIDPVIGANNWADQVDWFKPRYDAGPCPWIGRGQAVVLSNGDITRCCIDAFAKGVLGNILKDDITRMNISAFALCNRCHHSDPLNIITR